MSENSQLHTNIEEFHDWSAPKPKRWDDAKIDTPPATPDTPRGPVDETGTVSIDTQTIAVGFKAVTQPAPTHVGFPVVY